MLISKDIIQRELLIGDPSCLEAIFLTTGFNPLPTNRRKDKISYLSHNSKNHNSDNLKVVDFYSTLQSTSNKGKAIGCLTIR